MEIAVVILLASMLLLFSVRRLSAVGFFRSVSGGLLALNALVAVFAIGAAISLWKQAPTTVRGAALQQAQQQQQPPAAGAQAGGMAAIGASLAAGLAAIGAGIGVGLASAAAIGAITEKPEVLGRTLIFVGLAEGIAIYGLIISFIILTGGLGGGQ